MRVQATLLGFTAVYCFASGGCGPVQIGDRLYDTHDFSHAIAPSATVAVTMDLTGHVLKDQWSFGQSLFDTMIPGGTAVWAAHELEPDRHSLSSTTFMGQSASLWSDVDVSQMVGGMPPPD